LCLIDVAEEYTKVKNSKDLVLEHCINEGYILFNKKNYTDSNNFYVQHPEKILNYLTGHKWQVRKEISSYVPKQDEYVIEYWSWNNGATGQFARTKKGFNSLQSSKSVREGKILSYRICKVVD